MNDALASDAILSLLPLSVQQRVADIIVLPSVDSTNTYLLNLAAKGTPTDVKGTSTDTLCFAKEAKRTPTAAKGTPTNAAKGTPTNVKGVKGTSTVPLCFAKDAKGTPTGTLCFAETQTAGRGRRGRTWLSPAGSNLYFSVLEKLPQNAMGLSIVVGIAIARVLDRVGVPTVALKWPNDIYCQQKKLGGILIELSQRERDSYAVIGIGLNLDLPAEIMQQIDQPCIDLKTAMPSYSMSRNQLAANLIAELYSALNQFANGGLPSFMAEWTRLDMLQGKWVTVLQAQQQLHGIAEGVDEQGALQVRVSGQLHKIIGGEISVRLQRETL